MVVLASACLAACTGSVPRGPFTPPAAAQLEPETNALPSNGLRPEFTAAFARYQNAVKKVGSKKTEDRAGATQVAFERLAETIAKATPGDPYPSVVEPLANLRGYRLQMLGAPPITARAASGQALIQASRALSRLANGPYAGTPLVKARAQRLATTAAIASERLATNAEILRGLQEAEQVLGAMLAAATASPSEYGLPGANTDLPR
jgi:hypothetical protein